MAPKSDERSAGFTLVELLVAMIIIGMLAAVAVPVFLRQKVKARETAAKSDVSVLVKELSAVAVDGTPTSLALLSDAANGTWTLTSTVAGDARETSGRLSPGNDASLLWSTSTPGQFCVTVTPSAGSSAWSGSESALFLGPACS